MEPFLKKFILDEAAFTKNDLRFGEDKTIQVVHCCSGKCTVILELGNWLNLHFESWKASAYVWQVEPPLMQKW